jgi:hypothetical protein
MTVGIAEKSSGKESAHQQRCRWKWEKQLRDINSAGKRETGQLGKTHPQMILVFFEDSKVETRPLIGLR